MTELPGRKGVRLDLPGPKYLISLQNYQMYFGIQSASGLGAVTKEDLIRRQGVGKIGGDEDNPDEERNWPTAGGEPGVRGEL